MPALYDTENTGMLQKKHPIDDIVDRLKAGEHPDDITANMSQPSEQEQSQPSQLPSNSPDQLAADKTSRDADLQGKIESQENAIAGRGEGLNKGLLGAASTMSAVNAQINNRPDVTQEGYKRAIAALDEPNKQALTNREFLKERLGRTDLPMKTQAESAGLRSKMAGALGAERNERMGAALETPKLAEEQSAIKLGTKKNEAGLTALENAPVRNRVMASADKSLLQAIADKGGNNSKIAAGMLQDYDNTLGQLLPEDRKSLLNDMKSLNDQGKKFSLHPTTVGDNAGYTIIDESTGQEVGGKHEKKTTGADVANVRQGQKEEQTSQKRLDTFGKEVEGALASSRNGLGRINQLEQQVNRAEQLTKGGANLTPQQMYELSKAVDSAVSAGSGSTVFGTSHVLPRSISSSVADIEQYLTNKPAGAGQQEFVKSMMETLGRERDYAQKTHKDIVRRRAQTYGDLRDNPRYTDILKSQGENPDDYGPRGEYMPKQSTSTPQSGTVQPGQRKVLAPGQTLPPIE